MAGVFPTLYIFVPDLKYALDRTLPHLLVVTMLLFNT